LHAPYLANCCLRSFVGQLKLVNSEMTRQHSAMWAELAVG